LGLFTVSVFHNETSPLDEKQAKFCLFEGRKAGLRTKNGCFGMAVIHAIVFDAMIKKKDLCSIAFTGSVL